MALGAAAARLASSSLRRLSPLSPSPKSQSGGTHPSIRPSEKPTEMGAASSSCAAGRPSSSSPSPRRRPRIGLGGCFGGGSSAGDGGGLAAAASSSRALQENYTSENEVCGICRDIVIDRGVLDGCQHWFCYTCIDNWSAITNRCPLCKIEFQNITSTPVYDSTGTGDSIEDDYPLTSGDDDWYEPGESNTLSFPSYYIDAEAVVCLDGGDCIIRSGLVAAEDNSALDTSIACDSCDLWYHAICVGFNPETTSEDSWLCPRCVSTEAKNESEVVLKQNISGDSDRTSTDASFSGRVSVSVADDGETALVVSMVGVNSESKDDLLEGSLGSKTAQEAFYCNSHPSYSMDDLSHEAVANACIPRNKDFSCRSHNKSSETNLARMVSF